MVSKYLLAALPPFLLYGGWKLASWAYINFHCQGNIKGLQPCYAGSIDIAPLLGIGLFWCQVLWVPAIAVSGLFLLRIYRGQDNKIGL